MTHTHTHSRFQPISHFDCEALHDRIMEGEGGKIVVLIDREQIVGID